MLILRELALPLEGNLQENLTRAAAKRLGCPGEAFSQIRLLRQAVDCRKKQDIHFVCHALIAFANEAEERIALRLGNSACETYQAPQLQPPPLRRDSALRPVIAGFGPAGIFAALTLARAGLRPLVLERGACIKTRERDVSAFLQNRRLNPESNVQFGEGGAGAFSDGKLSTGIKDPLCREILEAFAAHGAPEEILVSAKPHIGTDRLGAVITSLRKKIEALGGELRFGCRLTDVIFANSSLHGVCWEEAGRQTELETDCLLLCIGHSARDTVEQLHRRGIQMQQKCFSIGARIEHPRTWIDRSQYGAFAGHPALGAADYKLACHPPHGRGAYTFCMCPGGTVVCAASESGGVVVNGMSEYVRDGENSNAALLVGVNPADEGVDVLAGFALQRRIEQSAFALGGGSYAAPAQSVGDFLAGRASARFSGVRPSCPTGAVPTDLHRLLPPTVTKTMAQALPLMGKKLRGFDAPQAILTAPETRSSSPVRILRDEYYQTNIRGIYPCGEGAGYAGGIVSAAVDGIRAAWRVMEDLR